MNLKNYRIFRFCHVVFFVPPRKIAVIFASIVLFFHVQLIFFSSPGSAQDKGGITSGQSTSVPPGATQDKSRDDEQPTELEKELKSKVLAMESLQTSREPIYISARRQEYRGETKEILYEGNVVVTRGKLSLRADRILFNSITNIGQMDGNVELSFDQDFITADRGQMNFATKELHLENCRGVIAPSLFFESDVLERLYPDPDTDRGRYYFKNMYFTPCNQLTPNWAITAREVYAHAEHYMHLYGSSFLLHNVPILWFPYWFYPIKSDRATGFLVPSFGYSSVDGFRIKNEFFLVLADNADVTLSHDFKEKYRNEGKVEFRYALDYLSMGTFTARYIHEIKDPFTKEEIPKDQRDMYLFRGYQIQRLPGEINWHLNLDYQNNPRINTVYGDTLGNQSQSFTNSWAGFTRNWSNALVSLDGSYYQSSLLTQNADHTFQHLPTLSVNVPNSRIGDSGLSYSLTTQLSHIVLFDTYTFDEGEETETVNSFYFDVDRFHIAPRLRYTFPKKKTWYQVTAQAELWYTQWSDRKQFFDEELAARYNWNTYNETFRFIYSQKEQSKEVNETFWAGTHASGSGLIREGYQASIDFAGPIVYRLFDTSNLSETMTRIKHRFWPGVTFEYTPDTNQSEILYFDPAIDYLPPTLGMTYYFKSDLIGRIYDPITETSTVRSLANFSVRQTFDYRLYEIYERRYNRYEEFYDDPSRVVGMPERTYYPFSNVTARLEILPSEKVWFLGVASYDPYWGRMQRLNLDLAIQLKRWYLRTGWGREQGLITSTFNKEGRPIKYDNIEYVYVASGGQVTGHWGYALNAHYDFRFNKFHHGNASIIYDAQCWGITLSFMGRQYNDQSLFLNRSYRELIPAKDEYNILISIHLKHVGEIGGYGYVEGFGLSQ